MNNLSFGAQIMQKSLYSMHTFKELNETFFFFFFFMSLNVATNEVWDARILLPYNFFSWMDANWLFIQLCEWCLVWQDLE